MTIDNSSDKCVKTYLSLDGVFTIHTQWKPGVNKSNSFYTPKLYEHFGYAFPTEILRSMELSSFYAISSFNFSRDIHKEKGIVLDYFSVFLNEPHKERKSEKLAALSVVRTELEDIINFEEEKFKELLKIHQTFLYDKILKQPKP